MLRAVPGGAPGCNRFISTTDPLLAKRPSMKRIAIMLAISLVTAQAQALENVVAKVIVVESSYMPATVSFRLSAGTASCPAGKWLIWQRDIENNKAVYAMLMSALVSDKKINIYFDDGDVSCVPKFMHLTE